jgi:hypothetical protein
MAENRVKNDSQKKKFPKDFLQIKKTKEYLTFEI